MLVYKAETSILTSIVLSGRGPSELVSSINLRKFFYVVFNKQSKVFSRVFHSDFPMGGGTFSDMSPPSGGGTKV